MATPTIERYTDVADDWRWRLVDTAEHVLADGTTAHGTRASLGAHLDRLRTLAPDVAVVAADGVVVLIEPGSRPTAIDGTGTVLSRGPEVSGLAAAREAAERAIAGDDAGWSTSTADLAEATVVEADPGVAVCHRGHDGEWRWQLRVDGRTVAESGEGYADAPTAREHAERTLEALPAAPTRTWG
ncbi:MAG: hypothetical protein ACOC0X_02855 [Halobacteriota archaeon]